MILSANATLRPREDRQPVQIPSRMRVGDGWSDVCIRNLSSRGACIAASAPPEQGSYVEIRRGGQTILGRVMWRNDREFGIRSQDPIDVASLLNEPRLARRQGDATIERRATQRVTAEQAERSRIVASALQFGFVASISLGFATFMAAKVEAVLSAPASQIQANL